MPQPPSRSSRNPPLTLLETTAHLREYFGSAVFSRGMAIRLTERAIKRLAVEELEDGEWHVQADIVGAGPEPYRTDVDVDIDPPTRRLEILSTVCTCPVEFDCKHAAGLLLKWFSLFQVDADGVLLDIAETEHKPVALGQGLDFADDDDDDGSGSDEGDEGDQGDKRAPRRKAADAAPTRAVRTTPVSAPVAAWLENTFAAEALPTATKVKTTATREALIFYVLADDASLHAVRGRRRRDGSEPELTGDYAGTAWLSGDRALPSYARPADKALLTLMVSEQNFALGSVAVALIGESGALLIELARTTGRIYGMNRQMLGKALSKSKTAAIVTQHRQLPPPLMFAALEAASLGWRIADREALKPLRLAATVKGLQVAIIATAPPMALDLAANCIFPVSVSVSSATLQRLASLPAIRSDDTTSWAFVRDAIAALPDADSVPPLPFTDDVAVPLPTAVLSFALIEYQTTTGWGKHAHTDTHTVPTAQLLFDYNGRRRPADRMGLNAAVEAELIDNRLAGTHLRNVRAEREWARRMPIALVPAVQVDYRIAQAALDGSATAPSLWALKDHNWTERGATVLADAQSAGFEIEIDPAFPLSLEDIPTPELALSPGQQNGWYRIALGVTINGEPVDIAPALARLIGAQKDPEAWLAAVADVPTVLLSVAHKKSKGGAVVVRLPGERVHALLTPVFDWFRGGALSPMSGLQAAMLPDLPATAVRYLGRDDPRWLAMRTAITDGAHLTSMSPAACFDAALRPYQLHGLSWLQHLYKIGMSGVLADDMGLGKTVQTLAFLHARRAQKVASAGAEARAEAGAETGAETGTAAAATARPSLIIAPTSVTVNWLAEIRRFTPSLKVVTHYGAERALTDETLAGADLVLTSYPILQRDDARFAQCEWDVVVFDEAQMIKNAKAKTYVAAQNLRAQMRLALTGTPMENHLGELWALFNLLLPGLLGDLDSFNRIFRHPIEQRAAAGQMQKLRQRARPFLLRRTREDVLDDLPEKTEYTRLIELLPGQVDVYESLRTAMDDDIRKVIEKKGLKQSTIHILDALLKLRQVCCDPRLVRLPDGGQNANRFAQAGSAKLDWLKAHVPELLEEGRHILIFSQFTSMLALIGEALTVDGIKYVTLTGDTRDRETPIREFQSGEVRVFLLSLKAGGVGLNLTAADTVIHYDPWWNPAVEAQATARAHRIGQVKPVFVTRLVAQGTLEESMMTLIARKRELAAALLDGEAGALTGITIADVESLLAPISSLAETPDTR